MATALNNTYECEHCDNIYNSRGPKSNHKFSHHYGGYDCDKCPGNYTSRELLNKHYLKLHGQKTNPNRDFGHLNKAQREEFDLVGLKRKKEGLSGIILSKETPPFLMEQKTQETTHPAVMEDAPGVDHGEESQDHISLDDPKIQAISGPILNPEPLNQSGEIEIEEMDIIDLETNTIASHENTRQVVDRVMSKEVRLGVNLRAEMHQMALTVERLFDEGSLTVEEILDFVRPKYS